MPVTRVALAVLPSMSRELRADRSAVKIGARSQPHRRGDSSTGGGREIQKLPRFLTNHPVARGGARLQFLTCTQHATGLASEEHRKIGERWP